MVIAQAEPGGRAAVTWSPGCVSRLAAQPQRGVEDLYEVLGVGHDASAAEIRKAYR